MDARHRYCYGSGFNIHIIFIILLTTFLVSNYAYMHHNIRFIFSGIVCSFLVTVAIIFLRNWTITARVLIAYNILVKNLNPKEVW